MYQLKKVYLEITNVCNLRCDFCPGTRRPQGFLSPEERLPHEMEIEILRVGPQLLG